MVVIVGKVKVLDVLSLASVKMKAPVPPLTLNIVDVAVLATTAAGVKINVSASTVTVAVPEIPRESIAVTVAEPAMVLAVKSPVEATMFPIEVGTWDASIAPWREKYGRTLRGVGGMNKTVFARDRAAVDAEIERLRPLVDLGGYIPCPDHRLAPDAEWDNVRYYCDRMHAVFSK